MSLLNGFIPVAQDKEGRTYPNAKLYTYDTGTYTPKVTYYNVGLSTPNPNPVISDGAGRFFNVFLGAGGYRAELRDEYDAVIWTEDDYYSNLTGADLINIDADIATVDQHLSQTFFVGRDTSGVADIYDLLPFGVQTLPIAYGDGMVLDWVPNHANTGAAAQVRIGSLPYKALLMPDGSNPPANFLLPSLGYQFFYINAFSAFVFSLRTGLVSTDGIASQAVTTDKIADQAVTTPKIADQAVTPAKMSTGTYTKLIGYDNGGVATEYNNPMLLLTSGSLTSAASLQFVLSSLDSAQSVDNVYMIRFIGIQPATSAKQLFGTISKDGGSTYLAGTGYYGRVFGYDTGGTLRVGAQNGTAQFTIVGDSGTSTACPSNAANKTISCDIYLYGFNTGTALFPQWRINAGYWADAANSYVNQSGGGSNNASADDYDAIKFTWESGGNFAAVGKYYLFKIPNVI